MAQALACDIRDFFDEPNGEPITPLKKGRKKRT
jgi:hypothetical protein